MGATGDVFEQFDVVSSSGATGIDVPKSGRVYAYVSNSGISKITALCGSSKKSFTGYTNNYIMDLGWHTEGDIITLSTDNTTSVLHTTAAMFKDVELKDTIARDGAETMRISYFTDTVITGTINVSGDKDLLFSIPYDRNWTVKVDGHEVSYKAWEETFISVHLTEGKHTIQLTYSNKYVTIGAILSFVCIGIWVVLAVYERKRRKKEDA